jgi:hypothetical protein
MLTMAICSVVFAIMLQINIAEHVSMIREGGSLLR